MKRGILVLVILIVLAVAVYFTWFYSSECEDESCFKARQIQCSKTSFVKDSEDATWLYKIKGKQGGKCEIRAEVLSMKKGSLEYKNLEGKSMDCFLNVGSVASPESDISLCTGELKEEMQNLIIQKLHKYIVDSVGEISEELERVV
jgi:hypothetical protein